MRSSFIAIAKAIKLVSVFVSYGPLLPQDEFQERVQPIAKRRLDASFKKAVETRPGGF